ncbi:squalene/phytoene synthase family protein [Parvularcula flava]|uniref:Phytoene synthase n=1 Tax=Aquisalinus luteolus TaxID=1566827 RepID=A0A8J3A6Y6_9PROT|nr:squalene/phytoene synthase family protein [Aquisalinus luteolus]NHK27475.1 squalene/phytoene synthase family protein [Aquisalinus luteolus]GGH95550.1 phytoene synthase [Aquisalinus luteolus]
MSGPEERYTDNIAYCRDEAARASPDLVLSAQFAPADERDRLMALYAFAAEIHRIPATVSEPPLGAIRQQWWREALEEIFSGGAVRVHPVAEALSVVLSDGRNCGVRALMEEAIDGIGWFLDGEAYSSPEGAVGKASASHGSIALAAAVLLAGEDIPAKDQLVIRHLEAIAAVSRQMGPQGAGDRSKAEGGPIATMSERLATFCEDDEQDDALRLYLLDEYRHNRKGTKRLPPSLMPAIAHAALIPVHLKAAEKLHRDRALTVSRFADFGRKARVTKAILTGTV